MGRPVGAEARDDPLSQKGRGVGEGFPAVAEWAVAEPHAPLLYEFPLLLRQEQAVGPQKAVREHSHPLQVHVGPHPLPADDPLHLAGVLVHVGLEHGSPLPGMLRRQAHQAVRAGI